jgi:riboflavin synthase alpha subunit
MSTNNDVWAITTREKLLSLLADEAKGAAILDSVSQTIKQLRAKSSFRLAIINQLLDDNDQSIKR